MEKIIKIILFALLATTSSAFCMRRYRTPSPQPVGAPGVFNEGAPLWLENPFETPPRQILRSRNLFQQTPPPAQNLYQTPPRQVIPSRDMLAEYVYKTHINFTRNGCYDVTRYHINMPYWRHSSVDWGLQNCNQEIKDVLDQTLYNLLDSIFNENFQRFSDALERLAELIHQDFIKQISINHFSILNFIKKEVWNFQIGELMCQLVDPEHQSYQAASHHDDDGAMDVDRDTQEQPHGYWHGYSSGYTKGLCNGYDNAKSINRNRRQ